MITFFVLLITLVLTYFMMLKYGVSSTKEAAGYILPFLPYLPLSAIGYYIKRKFFSSETKNSGCYGRSLEHCTNISHSAPEKGWLMEQQSVSNGYNGQFEDTQADWCNSTGPILDV